MVIAFSRHCSATATMVQRCPHGQGQRVPIVSGGPALGMGGSPSGVPCSQDISNGYVHTSACGSIPAGEGVAEARRLYGCKYRGSTATAGSPVAVGLDLEVGPPLFGRVRPTGLFPWLRPKSGPGECTGATGHDVQATPSFRGNYRSLLNCLLQIFSLAKGAGEGPEIGPSKRALI